MFPLKKSSFRSGPITTKLLAEFTSLWEINLPSSTSKLLTSRNSGVTPAIDIFKLFEFDWTISFAEICGATFLTLGTWLFIAIESSKTRFFGNDIPLLLVSLLPGTINKTFAPKLLNWFLARVWAPLPNPTSVITDALPIIIPVSYTHLTLPTKRIV